MLSESVLVLLGPAESAGSPQEWMSSRVAFFLSGVLMALVPLIVFGALGAFLIRLHLRSVKQTRKGGAGGEGR